MRSPNLRWSSSADVMVPGSGIGPASFPVIEHDGSGQITYTSNQPLVVSVGENYEINGYGWAALDVIVTITASLAADGDYEAQEVSYRIVFPKSAVKISFSDSGIVKKTKETWTITPRVIVDSTVDGVESTPNNRHYVYDVLDANGHVSNIVAVAVSNTSCQITAGAVAGIAKVKVTVTVLLANGHRSTASASLVVTVVDAENGDTNDPRPVTTDYPNYTGTAMPPLAAVRALLNDLMPDDTPNAPDINSTAAQLFGLDYEYFALVGQNNKRTVFQIGERNDIYQASCTAASHLRLKVSKEMILGDNIAFSVTRGNTFSVTLNLNDKSDQSDKTIEGNGVTNISMIGVANKLELETFSAHEDDYYSYDKSPGTGTNYVYIPKLKVLNLDYGKITCFRRDRAISLEFMGLDHYRLTPDNAHFANYSEIRKDQIPPTLLTKANNRSFDRGLLPAEENLGLLNGYFRDEGKEDAPGCMQQYHKINLPPDLLADPTLDTGGANILQFMHGKGRLAYDYMDGGMKTFLKTRDSNILMYVGPIVTESVACAAFVKLEYYAFMITNQVMSPWHFNTDFILYNGNTVISLLRFSASLVQHDFHQEFGNLIKEKLGVEVEAAGQEKWIRGGLVHHAGIFCSYMATSAVKYLSYRADTTTMEVSSSSITMENIGSYIASAALAMNVGTYIHPA